ncbi:MAG TPA: YppE family protein [Sporolactobacillaceae bacterium]|nr:YppE family protein [Sporolactobacillaceae bacterium]
MNESQLHRLREITDELKKLNGYLKTHFIEVTKKEGYEVDFYGVVKPFADHMTKLLEEWQPLLMDWLRWKKPKYVFVPQIIDTVDNLTIVSVTAFQKDTRRLRFLNTIHAIDHVLDTILEQIPDNIGLG